MGLHDGHRKRLKEQFLNHGDGFHDHQLLELLLCYAIPQGDVNGLAHRLLDRFGSLAGVLDARPEALTQVLGVGEHTAVLLKLIPVLSGRYQADRAGMGTILDSTQAAGQYLRPYFSQGARYEMAYLVCLDGKYKVLGCHKLGEGTVNAASITVKKVVEEAVTANATAVILAHNHPGGLPLPSRDDRAATEKVAQALALIGVRLLDHIIVCDGEFASMADSGMLPAAEP